MGKDDTNADSGSSHGQRGAAAGETGDHEQLDEKAPLTIGTIKSLLAEEREAFNRQLNAALAAERRRAKAAPAPKAPIEPKADDDETDPDDDAHEDRSRSKGSDRGKGADNAETRESAKLRRDMAAMRAQMAERDKRDAERERHEKERSNEQKRDSQLLRAVKAVPDVADLDDACAVIRGMLGRGELSLSEDGAEYVFTISGVEADFEDAVKKKITAKAHLLKPPTKDGNGAISSPAQRGKSNPFSGVKTQADELAAAESFLESNRAASTQRKSAS